MKKYICGLLSVSIIMGVVSLPSALAENATTNVEPSAAQDFEFEETKGADYMPLEIQPAADIYNDLSTTLYSSSRVLTPGVNILSPFAGVYSEGTLTALEYVCNVDNLNYVEFYIDGVPIDSSIEFEGRFTIDNLSKGNHALKVIAYDISGERQEQSVEILITGFVEKTLADSDFSSYTGGNPAGFNCVTDENNGYIKPIKIDNEHGQSIRVGGDGRSTGSGPFVGISSDDTNDTVVLDMDVYFPNHNAEFQLTVRNKDNWNSLGLCRFNDGKISLYGEGGTLAGSDKLVYNLEQWYHVKYVLNGKTNRYDFWLNGEKIAENRLASGYDLVTVLNTLRLIVFVKTDDGGYVVFDNVKAKRIINFPYVTSVGSVKGGNESSSANYDADTLTAKLSSQVSPLTVSSNVRLSNRFGDVECTQISYDQNSQSILIKPKYPLKSNMKYTVLLGSKLATSDKYEIGYEQKHEFTTTAKPLDVLHGKFLKKDGKVAFSPLISNQTSDIRNAASIITVWNGNQMLFSRVSESSVQPSKEAYVATPYVEVPSGSRVEGYVWDSLAGLWVLTENWCESDSQHAEEVRYPNQSDTFSLFEGSEPWEAASGENGVHTNSELPLWTFSNGMAQASDSAGSMFNTRPAGGVFGKEASDTALCFESIIYNAANNLGALPKMEKTAPAYNSAQGTKLEYGDYVHLSFEMAAENKNTDRYVQISLDGQRASVGNTANLVYIKDGQISLLDNQIVNVKTLSENEWTRFDFIIYCDGAKVESYINGEKIQGEYALKDYTTADIFWSYSIGVTPLKSGDMYTLQRTYVDNIIFSANEGTPYVTAFTPLGCNLYTWNFNNYDGTIKTWGTGLQRGNLSAAAKNVITYNSSVGKYGKAYSDKYLTVSNTNGSMPEGTGSDGIYKYITNPFVQLPGIKKLIQGDVVRLGFSVMKEDNLNEKVFSIISSEGNMDGEYNFFTLTTDGKAKLGGEAVNIPVMQLKKWYDIELLLQVGDGTGTVKNKAFLYINGKKYLDGKEFSAGAKDDYKQLTEVASVRCGYDFKNNIEDAAQRKYAASGFVIDDIRYGKYQSISVAKVSEVVLSHADAEIEALVNEETFSIVLGRRETTVEELTGFTASNAEVCVVDDVGEMISTGDASGCYLKIVTTAGGIYYYSVEGLPKPLYESDFSKTITSSAKPYNTENWWEFNTDKPATVSGIKGLNGKTSDDQSMVMTTTNFNSASNYDPYIQFNIPEDLKGQFTLEVSVSFEKTGNAAFKIETPLQNDTSQWKTIADFRANKALHGLSSSDYFGSWDGLQWYKIVFTTDTVSGASSVSVYRANGTLINKLTPTLTSTKAGDNFYRRFKFTANYPTSGGPHSNYFAIDDVKLYRGEYRGD